MMKKKCMWNSLPVFTNSVGPSAITLTQGASRCPHVGATSVLGLRPELLLHITARKARKLPLFTSCLHVEEHIVCKLALQVNYPKNQQVSFVEQFTAVLETIVIPCGAGGHFLTSSLALQLAVAIPSVDNCVLRNGVTVCLYLFLILYFLSPM